VTRADIYTAAARGVYSGKPRPVVIVQDDRFDATASVTVCPLTTNPVDVPLFRLPVEPSEANGLNELSFLMVDKVTTMPRGNLREHLGRLGDNHVVQLNRALIVFFGLAESATGS
jgi:mRNA interferase MazF